MSSSLEEMDACVLDIYRWRYVSSADNFRVQLYALMKKADSCNRAKLFKAFPSEGAVFSAWYSADSEVQFFEHHGFRVLNSKEGIG